MLLLKAESSKLKANKGGDSAMADKIKPEIIAAITAAIQFICGGGKVVAVKIKRNDNWALAGKLRN